MTTIWDELSFHNLGLSRSNGFDWWPNVALFVTATPLNRQREVFIGVTRKAVKAPVGRVSIITRWG